MLSVLCSSFCGVTYLRSSVIVSSFPTSPKYNQPSALGLPALSIPPSVLMGGPALCDTCVIMLEGPPAAAMTYVKASMGLVPSVYGGGGSPSSRFRVEDSALESLGSVGWVAATRCSSSSSARASAKEGAGAVAKMCSLMASVTATLNLSTSSWLGK